MKKRRREKSRRRRRRRRRSGLVESKNSQAESLSVQVLAAETLGRLEGSVVLFMRKQTVLYSFVCPVFTIVL
jgi:hypothetical protein